MELLVTITLTDRLYNLLEDKLPNLGRRVEKILTKELGRQARSETEITVTKATEAAPVATEPEAPQTAEAKQDTAAPGTAETTAGPRNLPEEIRAIIDRTRRRFQGEDYKENPKGEGSLKHKCTLTRQFKQIALTLGYEKPSFIDTPEKVDAFAAECDALILDEKGLVSPPPAPY